MATPPELDAETLAFAHGVFESARAGDADRLADLLEHGLSVDLTNGSGDTLLVLAAYHGRPAAVRLLLDHGADHARTNDRGQTALAAAVFRQDVASATALLAAGADPALGRQSALATAVVFELPEMAALLSGRR